MKPKPVRQTYSTQEIRKCKKQTPGQHRSLAIVKQSTEPSAGRRLDHREAYALTEHLRESSGNTQHRGRHDSQLSLGTNEGRTAVGAVELEAGRQEGEVPTLVLLPRGKLAFPTLDTGHICGAIKRTCSTSCRTCLEGMAPPWGNT